MKTPLPVISLLLCLLTTLQLHAQDGNKNRVITDAVTGHIFRPRQVDATAENIKQLQLPQGFTITKFAGNLNKPRMIKITPEGFIYVTDRDAGTVTLLQDKDGDGKADVTKLVAHEEQMHGIDYYDGKLYLITVTKVYTADVKSDGTLGALKTIMINLPDGGQHANRTLHFGPDNMLYISVGSECNSCDEPNVESATILQAPPDGSSRHIFAQGLRNTIGFSWHPVTKELWGFDHGIDWLGDNDQREELNHLEARKNYGWPYVYADGKFDKHASPPHSTYEAYLKKTTLPVMLYTAHAAPMDLLFYTGKQFPDEYKNDAFATMHGSWNRETPSGYRIVHVHFDGGKPVQITDFVTGFYNNSDSTMFGRLVGLAQMKDGSLLVADDVNGVIYRISYGNNAIVAQARKEE